VQKHAVGCKAKGSDCCGGSFGGISSRVRADGYGGGREGAWTHPYRSGCSRRACAISERRARKKRVAVGEDEFMPRREAVPRAVAAAFRSFDTAMIAPLQRLICDYSNPELNPISRFDLNRARDSLVELHYDGHRYLYAGMCESSFDTAVTARQPLEVIGCFSST
jgi:hypothetical protein